MADIVLRDYQEDGVEGIRLAFREGKHPTLFVLATGGGKTFTFSYIANNAAKLGHQVIIVVHRKELLLQASASLRALGVEHGIISPHFTSDPRKKIQVASIDTLLIRVKKNPNAYKFALLIFDEAHHVVKDNKWGRAWYELGQPRTLGVTATPVRADGKGLGEHAGGIFKEMVLGPSIGWLIGQGMLINPTVYTSLETPDMTGVKKKKDGEYNERQLAERVDKPVITGSAVKQYKKICPGARAIAFCINIEHAKHVVDEFNAAGYRFALLVGEPEMKDSERTKVNNMLKRGEIDGAATVDLVSEGYDLPDLECCIMLRPTMSESLYIQQVGRIMRPSKGKTRCFLLDHVGNVGAIIDGVFVKKHGLPDELREWTLDGRVKGKGKKKAKDELLDVAQCPKCYLAHMPAPTCPACGHVYEVKSRKLEQVDGELAELTPERLSQLKHEKRKEVKRAASLEDLERIAAERGYSKGWAAHTHAAKARSREKYLARPQARPERPVEPTRDELLAMTLEQLLKVEREQGWPMGTALEFYNEHNQLNLGDD